MEIIMSLASLASVSIAGILFGFCFNAGAELGKIVWKQLTQKKKAIRKKTAPR